MMKTIPLLASVIFGFVILFPFSAHAHRDYPSMENLQQAKTMINSLQVRVQNLIDLIREGGPDENRCERITNSRECERSGCDWILEGSHRFRRGYCKSSRNHDDHHTVILENDFAANHALLGLGRGLTDLGEKVDEATANFGTPGFFNPWHEACDADRRLTHGARAGRTAAELPILGLVHGSDFNEIEDELREVDQLLLCP